MKKENKSLRTHHFFKLRSASLMISMASSLLVLNGNVRSSVSSVLLNACSLYPVALAIVLERKTLLQLVASRSRSVLQNFLESSVSSTNITLVVSVSRGFSLFIIQWQEYLRSSLFSAHNAFARYLIHVLRMSSDDNG